MSTIDDHRRACFAILRNEAIGRVDTVTAVLSMSPAPSDDDVAWAASALASLVHLCSRLSIDAADVVRTSSTFVTCTPGERTDSRDALIAVLSAVRGSLLNAAHGPVPEHVRLSAIADAAREETARLAAVQQVAIVAEVETRNDSAVSATTAGALLEATGLVLAHMARVGCVYGGSVRIEVRREGEDIALTLGDRGNAASREAPAPDSGPELAGARTRLMALGAELSVSAAPWGGTSVVIKVRDRTGMGAVSVKRRG